MKSKKYITTKEVIEKYLDAISRYPVEDLVSLFPDDLWELESVEHSLEGVWADLEYSLDNVFSEILSKFEEEESPDEN